MKDMEKKHLKTFFAKHFTNQYGPPLQFDVGQMHIMLVGPVYENATISLDKMHGKSSQFFCNIGYLIMLFIYC